MERIHHVLKPIQKTDFKWLNQRKSYKPKKVNLILLFRIKYPEIQWLRQN